MVFIAWFLLWSGPHRPSAALSSPWGQHRRWVDVANMGFALDRMAMPLALAQREDRWFGLDWDSHYQIYDGDEEIGSPASWGESEPQIGCGLSWQDDMGELRLNLPANEAPRRHARNPNDSATDKLLWLGPGQRLELTVELHDYAGDRHAYQPTLRQVYGRLKGEHPAPAGEAHAP